MPVFRYANDMQIRVTNHFYPPKKNQEENKNPRNKSKLKKTHLSQSDSEEIKPRSVKHNTKKHSIILHSTHASLSQQVHQHTTTEIHPKKHLNRHT